MEDQDNELCKTKMKTCIGIIDDLGLESFVEKKEKFSYGSDRV